jgi:hypothetical protein
LSPKDPAGLGVAPHVADAVLGHREASLGFDRYTAEPERYLITEKREALTGWGQFVRQLMKADRPSAEQAETPKASVKLSELVT